MLATPIEVPKGALTLSSGNRYFVIRVKSDSVDISKKGNVVAEKNKQFLGHNVQFQH